ncbi:MAG: recombinase RecT, partial [Ruthenibacterium sp.]
MAENNQISKAQDFRSIVQKTADAYIPLVESQLTGGGPKVDGYQRQCMSNALVVINDVANAAGEKSLEAFAKTEVMEILQQVATLRLNAFSQPRECYFQTRKKKMPDGSWGISVEMGIEGDGNDTILRNFGHGVEEVYPYWTVREDDEFTYPRYHGIEVDPPTWTPGGKGKIIRVVYPIRYKDGTVRYFISERSDVRANLTAHISNNMMNETFGIAESRYKATLEQKKNIDTRKAELKALMDGKDVDEIMEIPDLQT